MPREANRVGQIGIEIGLTTSQLERAQHMASGSTKVVPSINPANTTRGFVYHHEVQKLLLPNLQSYGQTQAVSNLSLIANTPLVLVKADLDAMSNEWKLLNLPPGYAAQDDAQDNDAITSVMTSARIRRRAVPQAIPTITDVTILRDFSPTRALMTRPEVVQSIHISLLVLLSYTDLSQERLGDSAGPITRSRSSPPSLWHVIGYEPSTPLTLEPDLQSTVADPTGSSNNQKTLIPSDQSSPSSSTSDVKDKDDHQSFDSFHTNTTGETARLAKQLQPEDIIEDAKPQSSLNIMSKSSLGLNSIKCYTKNSMGPTSLPGATVG
ncbi:hypothetical protein PTTG_27878 [Puccinia triticina 1-1 BBBD Race 1]|uniref:Uncharacterized protein n=1 Tax=Puccinia triticina (isolate 1-1 / race 1 (BBBD)) TaxID=630390 RepID=A0A180GH79_PUCT1|nr:hypothetical protein PTTG_27878 [Puccinia triticina 1-1 BBBD Race 1]